MSPDIGYNICESLSSVYLVKSKSLGKESQFHAMLSQIKNLDLVKKIEIGKLINETKKEFLDLIQEYELRFASISTNTIDQDIFLVTKDVNLGSIHPVTKITKEIEKFLSIFSFVKVNGQDVDDDWHNFKGLNFEDNHPARQMHDTFYLNYQNLILRTHTSNMQIRFMSKNKPPFRFYSHGRTYRKDSDRTHTPMFHQMEIVMVDEKINIGNLKWFIKELLTYLFGNKLTMRFRPNFFPFTESSLEVDIKLNDKWMEVLGSGMIHNNVFKNTNIDLTKYSGFAIGFGLDRLAMIKYKIPDLRQMFEPDFNFIKEYNKL